MHRPRAEGDGPPHGDLLTLFCISESPVQGNRHTAPTDLACRNSLLSSFGGRPLSLPEPSFPPSPTHRFAFKREARLRFDFRCDPQRFLELIQ